MASHYDAVLAAIPTLLVGGVAGDILVRQFPAAVPLSTSIVQVPLTVAGTLVAVLLVGRELVDPPTG